MMEQYVLVNRVRNALQKEDLEMADHYAQAAGLTFDDFSAELTPPVTSPGAMNNSGVANC